MKLRLLQIWLLTMMSGFIFGQKVKRPSINYEEYDLVEMYTIEEATEHIKPKEIGMHELSPIDKLKMAPRSEVKHYYNLMDKKGNVRTEIYYERPTHVEKWLNYPTKTIITDAYTASYDDVGKELSRLDLDEEAKRKKIEQNKAIRLNGNFQDVSFDKLSDKEIKEVLKEKGKIKKISAFGEEIEYDSLILRNIPEKLSKQYIWKDSNRDKDKRQTSVGLKFAINSEGDYYLKSKAELSNNEFSSKDGLILNGTYKVVSSYIDYNIYIDTKYKKLKDRSATLNMEILENPVQGQYLGIFINGEITKYNLQNLKISIFNTVGILMKIENINVASSRISIDISSLPSGTYIIKSNSKELGSTIKFVKI